MKKSKIKRLDNKLKSIQKKKEVYEKKQEIKEIKKSIRPNITTTKIIVGFIFVNCTVVEIYSMVAMWVLNDLSALYTLITAVIGEAISFGIYAAKSYNETKQEALVNLEYEKLSYKQEDSPEDDSSNDNVDEDK